ncbi:Stp1/IreP family PP2C-type Ser/Thr phosphatase [Salipaludibacillus daqingensis]|uniref:Stp1/IreP family PP2C-type Ser/Thr phosphatase n=1 Tax=Salipaludibacillus daqingensis TaxID=3041001 RepID=UPI002475C0D7|nr:Stp1/IreP family PP2C-type Ser/Thr phosphatase [Salipaludibacillus daqingensis]
MEGIFRTDIGKLRAHNEDNGAISEGEVGQMLALVADGMGGHQAGDVASEMAKEAMLKHWQEISGHFTPKEAEKWLLETVSKVNKELFSYSQSHPQCEGMGTTLVAALCSDEFVTYSNVGDSRVYLYEEEVLRQLSDDHSLVGELVRKGQLSEEEAEHHPRKNVLLRALGTEETIEVDVETVGWKNGSVLLLCSDGLTNKLSDQDIQSQIATNQPLETVAEKLVEQANDNGGEDNITISLVRHETKDVSLS